MVKTDSKRKFLIATHGTFAAGIKSSLDMIIGAMENVSLIQAGGSVTNQVLQRLLKPNVHVVSGFNLPLVIDVLLADAEIPIEEVISESLNTAKEQMVYVNKMISAQNTASDYD
jgi:fructoselysine and glucoselysine-specific PTS system IIA component